MNTDLQDIIAELQRIRDDLAWTDAEDIEDTAPDLCDRLQGVIDALFAMIPGEGVIDG